MCRDEVGVIVDCTDYDCKIQVIEKGNTHLGE